MWVGGQRHAPAALPPVPIVSEVGWAPGPVWNGCGKSRPLPGIRFPDRPASSESLYRLSYPGPHVSLYPLENICFHLHFDLIYRGADKSLARPTSQCILFDGENISFDASLVLCICMYICMYVCMHIYIYTHTYIYIYIILIFLQF
jgi:hypothetical protein